MSFHANVLLVTAIVMVLVSASVATVPIVDHWAAKTSVINAHRATTKAPRPTPTAVAGADSQEGSAVEEQYSDAPSSSSSSSNGGDLNLNNVADQSEVASGEASASSEELAAVQEVSKKPIATARVAVHSTLSPIAAGKVPGDAKTTALHSTTDEDLINAQFDSVLKSKPIFSAFLEDMATQEAQRASYQGELVDVKCPSSGGQCDLVFHHG